MTFRSVFSLFPLALLVAAAPAFGDTIKLADLLATLKADDVAITTLNEDASEASTADLGYKIKGGGALVLCEGGQLKEAGKNGNCKSPNKDGVSDVLAFVAGQKILTLYSDPFPKDFSLKKDDLKDKFGPYVAYVEEGFYYDEKTEKSIQISDPNVSVYVRRAKNFERAFVMGSDTKEAETPEPGTLIAFTGALAVLTLMAKNRRTKSEIT